MPKKQASENSKYDNVFGLVRGLSKMFPVGLYARVSTNDQQTLAMQTEPGRTGVCLPARFYFHRRVTFSTRVPDILHETERRSAAIELLGVHL